MKSEAWKRVRGKIPIGIVCKFKKRHPSRDIFIGISDDGFSIRTLNFPMSIKDVTDYSIMDMTGPRRMESKFIVARDVVEAVEGYENFDHASSWRTLEIAVSTSIGTNQIYKPEIKEFATQESAQAECDRRNSGNKD